MKKFITLLLMLGLLSGLMACSIQSNNYSTSNENISEDYNISNEENNDFPVVNTDSTNQKTTSDNVAYISNRTLQDDENGYVFLFSFLDANENEIKSPATVSLKIVNDEGTTVYLSKKNIKESDFSTWSNRSSGQSWLQAAVYINFAEISEGTTDKGKFYYKISLNSSSFDEYSLNIDGLPIKKSTITLPTLPKKIHSYDYNDKIETSVKITNITYEINGDNLYLYFTGEKTFDDEGSGYSRACEIGWKLYDSEGYIKDSGTFYSPGIKVGEKFKDEKEYVFDVIKPGESYRLEIENVS